MNSPAPDLLEQTDRTIAQAMANGALQPIHTERTVLHQNGFDFSVRWVSSLALKDAARVDAVTRKRPGFNPFLPPDPDLTVASLGPRHLAVLNKYPVIERHLLIITRDFEAQTAPLTLADFTALAYVMQAHGGLGFYNGGQVAGASQSHKHLQWVPAKTDLHTLAAIPSNHYDASQLPWRQLRTPLPAGCWSSADTAAAWLETIYRNACDALDLQPVTDPMPPYNLLVTREWMTVVPRSQEKCDGISVNALGFAGSLFVREHQQIEHLRTIGPLALLQRVATGQPSR